MSLSMKAWFAKIGVTISAVSDLTNALVAESAQISTATNPQIGWKHIPEDWRLL